MKTGWKSCHSHAQVHQQTIVTNIQTKFPHANNRAKPERHNASFPGKSNSCSQGFRLLCQIEKHNVGRIAYWGVMPGETQIASFCIDTEHSDIVPALIAAIKEIAGWIEGETAGVIPPGPLLPDITQCSILTHGKNSDAIVEPVTRVNKAAIMGNQNFRAEIASGKFRGQGGYGLPCGEFSGFGFIIK